MSTAPTGPIPSIPLGHTAGFNSSARRSISPSPLSILLNSSSSIHSAESTSRTLDSQTHIGVIRSGSIDLAANQLPTQALQHIIDLAPRYLQLRHEEQSLQEAAKQLDSIQERLTTSQDNLTAFEAELVDVDAHIETMKKTRNRMFFGARAKYNQAILDLESRRTTIDLSIPAMIREIASLQLQRHDYRDVSRQISEIRDELQNIFSNVFEVYASSFSTERELNHKVVDILSKIRVLREQHRVSSRIHSIYIETRSSLEEIKLSISKGKLKPAKAVPSVMEATQSFGYILQLRPDTVNPFMGVDQKYARPYDQRNNPTEAHLTAIQEAITLQIESISWESDEYVKEIEYMNTHLKAAMSRLERERHHIVLLAVASRRRQLRGTTYTHGHSQSFDAFNTRNSVSTLGVSSRHGSQIEGGSQTDEGISPTDNESQRSDSQLSSPRLSHVTLPYVPRPLSPRLPQASQPRMIPHGAIRRGSASLQVVSPLSGRHSSAQSTSAKGELPVWARQTVIDPPRQGQVQRSFSFQQSRI
ncbi:hypothetical protein BASA50_010217 [Batrachochytrium salamandrivorans]|uniref:Up-regulated during septation protein 1 domain-containing protein n=1 Tax=Batrachochytrium salamandrivorans TaxID=1357716 RepID=A0ABQ8EZ70_9FUNG|nr:hypothetical protein BASA62_006853 [Batrachochytrium salamandrivorans]KAH6579194.1 hypothetical protein BASA61_010391 [Batrachochytrium salamandrivorans]KAH6583804.1 hypothetical protein BASA60_001264 [Batrachochytrium salamandrivorans]KAH6589175.1 hypothetical protein BASA50_010217 [Batrachochytrium salamandrivorans]KAH9270839.1 hypothetical protein BASA83_006992 [Batrachochytrium salamandrivorans]